MARFVFVLKSRIEIEDFSSFKDSGLIYFDVKNFPWLPQGMHMLSTLEFLTETYRRKITE